MTPHSTLAAAVLTLILCSVATAQSPPPPQDAKPLYVEVEPNALQRLKKKALDPMNIEIWGAGPKATVHLEVLQDCDGDRIADRPGTETCKSPLDAWESPPAGREGHIRTELDFATRSWELPENVALWLRVSRSVDAEGGTLVPFGLVLNPCELWARLVDTFWGGDCDPGLLQALRQHKGPAGLEDVTFEVRRLAVGAEGTPRVAAEPVAVPGTEGATGIAWANPSTLLVTRAPVVLDVPPKRSHQKRAAAVPAGLYRVRLAPDGSTADTGAHELLWEPKNDGLMPAAPFALKKDRIAFVRQSLGDPVVDGKSTVLLSFWQNGALESSEIPLPYRVHQILAKSADEEEILALSLGVGSNRPLFLRIHLNDQTVDLVGYHHDLYRTAMRSPDGTTSAIAMDDTSGRWGWELVAIDGAGGVTPLVHRKKLHDFMPTWHPHGGELAFLAEVSRIERGGR